MIFELDKKAAKQFIKFVSKEAEKDSPKIAPTPFFYEYEVDYKSTFSTIVGKYEMNINEAYVKRESFVTCTKSLGQILALINKPAANLLGIIIANLEFEANYIVLSEKDFISITNYSKQAFYSAISELVDKQVIRVTNKKSVYIINHNILFKGNIIDFTVKYKRKFPNGCITDETGRVIINGK